MKADWFSIKNEYVNGKMSYRELAKKYGISADTLTRRAGREEWAKKRKNNYSKITAKVQQKTADLLAKKEVDRMEKVLMLSDALVEKIAQATGQLEGYSLDTKVVRKVIRKEGDNSVEIVEEIEEAQEVKRPISAKALKELTGALKDINQICANDLGKASDVADKVVINIGNRPLEDNG